MTNHNHQYYRDGYLDVPFCSKCGKEGSELVAECIPLTYDKSEIELKNKLTEMWNEPKSLSLNNPFNNSNQRKNYD